MFEMLFGQRIGREKRLFSSLTDSCPFVLCHVRNVFSLNGFILAESCWVFFSFSLICSSFSVTGKEKVLQRGMDTG